MPPPDPQMCFEHGRLIAVMQEKIDNMMELDKEIYKDIKEILKNTTEFGIRLENVEKELQRNFDEDAELRTRVTSIEETLIGMKGYGRGVLAVVVLLSGSVGFLTAVIGLISQLK